MLHPKSLLDQYNLKAKKSLGQNFIFDDNVLARIAAVANLQPADNVLEIGPGLGSLTRHLAQAVGRVVAVELDDRLLPILETELADLPNVEIVHADILAVDPADWFGDTPYKVVANVPYYITGAILRHLLTGRSKPTMMVMTVQKEVAQRLTAAPGDMSLLSVSVQFYGQPAIVEEIKAGAFWPRPDIDSAVIAIDLQHQPPLAVEDEAAFFRVVKAGFSQKRKQLHNNLRGLGYSATAIETILAATGIDGRRRAETLTLDEWAALYQEMNLLVS